MSFTMQSLLVTMKIAWLVIHISVGYNPREKATRETLTAVILATASNEKV